MLALSSTLTSADSFVGFATTFALAPLVAGHLVSAPFDGALVRIGRFALQFGIDAEAIYGAITRPVVFMHHAIRLRSENGSLAALPAKATGALCANQLDIRHTSLSPSSTHCTCHNWYRYTETALSPFSMDSKHA